MLMFNLPGGILIAANFRGQLTRRMSCGVRGSSPRGSPRGVAGCHTEQLWLEVGWAVVPIGAAVICA
jgi:hypothetical protein